MLDSLADRTLHYFNTSNPHITTVPPIYACLDASGAGESKTKTWKSTISRVGHEKIHKN
jgi:hypothetical protein